ncbi:uncharacterized protein BDZ99DRAFT_336842, partial [Mytilinidion resinicola]
AFKIEQNKRKRQKNLFQILASNEGGRAIIYSPSKVRQARELHQEKEDAKARDISSKAEDKVQKRLAKEEKERIAELNRTRKATTKKEKDDAAALKKRQLEEIRIAREFEFELR